MQRIPPRQLSPMAEYATLFRPPRSENGTVWTIKIPTLSTALPVAIISKTNRKRSPAAVGPPGSLGGNAQRGPRTATRQAMDARRSPSPRARGPSSAPPNSMGQKPSHPDAECIADDVGDENGEHQRPAAKVVIEMHRMSTAAGSTLPHTGRARLRAEALLPASCP